MNHARAEILQLLYAFGDGQVGVGDLARKRHKLCRSIALGHRFANEQTTSNRVTDCGFSLGQSFPVGKGIFRINRNEATARRIVKPPEGQSPVHAESVK